MKIIDNFLKGDRALEQLTSQNLWMELASKDTVNWVRGNSLCNVWEYIVTKAASEHASDVVNTYFEYWANIISDGDELDWHQDKIEKIANEKIITPKLGMVYYGYPHRFLGGMLEIAESEEYSELVEAKYDRLVVFDPGIPHRVTKVTAGTRCGFQINFW